MAEMKIDLDDEKILIEGRWMSGADIKAEIKARVNADNYDIEDLTQALKMLENALKNSVPMTFRVPTELADKLNAMANKRGESVGNILREALGYYLSEGGEISAAELEREEEEETEEESEEVEEEEFVPEVEEEEEEEEIDLTEITRPRRRRRRR
ncbi:MAG: hypothetical protein DRN20_02955 [Thermoplasmata archaeon]|nr:MAG: hypothetical protein DRN20_02955 [Thermoplasmata archaeon]